MEELMDLDMSKKKNDQKKTVFDDECELSEKNLMISEKRKDAQTENTEQWVIYE